MKCINVIRKYLGKALRTHFIKLICGIGAISTAFVFLIYLFFLPSDDSFLNQLPQFQHHHYINHRKLVPKYKSYDERLSNMKYSEFDQDQKRKRKDVINDVNMNNDLSLENSLLEDTSPKKLIINTSNFIELGMIRSVADKKAKDVGFKKYAFNGLVSDRIGIRRSIPDTRFGLCKEVEYPKEELLHTSSIIICFYNEAFSALMRTVYSVIDRTQDGLIQEILLVDDFSDNGLQDQLSEYLKKNYEPKVKYIRTPERAGLMRARIFGAAHATGKALLFLDSHCEVNQNWLVPLLARVYNDRKTVAVPIIDIISQDTFEYTSSPIVRGGFNWGLHFKWDSVPYKLLRGKSDYIKPISSPTMAGGLFAIDKHYFHEIGEYDRGMDIWGGENLEISFRIWMCGGRIEIIPCSRVGHVFRNRRPYGAPNGEDTLTINSLRLAHVWMDKYIKYFFDIRPEARYMEYGDISERLEIKKRLKCNSFDWYIKNVYPELKPPIPKDQRRKLVERKKSVKKLKPLTARKTPLVVNTYKIQLSGRNLCIESEKEVTAKGSRLVLSKCVGTKRQVWSETELHEFRLSNMLCLEANSHFPFLSKCHEMGNNQEWKHASKTNSPLYNMAAGLCLGLRRILVGEQLVMSICANRAAQKWNFIPVKQD